MVEVWKSQLCDYGGVFPLLLSLGYNFFEFFSFIFDSDLFHLFDQVFELFLFGQVKFAELFHFTFNKML